MKTINLTQNQIALVDDWWFDEINKYKWQAHWNKKTQSFYAMRSVGSSVVHMHRIIAKTPRGMLCDHIDHNTLRNLESNLRNCTNHQNMANRKGANTNSKSGIRGVSWHKGSGKWQSAIQVHGKHVYVGTFDSVVDAEVAVIAARKKYFGEFSGNN